MGFLDRIINVGEDVWDELTDVSGRFPVSPDIRIQQQMEIEKSRREAQMMNMMVQQIMAQGFNPNHPGPQFNPAVRLDGGQVQDMRPLTYFSRPNIGIFEDGSAIGVPFDFPVRTRNW